MVVILLSITCVMQCSENPATIENVYPRGNHWAVGKKYFNNDNNIAGFLNEDINVKILIIEL